jgi:acetyltransferase-like isoleucine patch superfamily enzyme
MSQKIILKDYGAKNEIIVDTPDDRIQNCKIVFNGDNHSIIIGKNVKLIDVTIKVEGNSNVVKIGDWSRVKGVITLGGEHQIIDIGKDCHLGDADLNAQENTSITIGEDALISYGVSIRTTDSHSIIDRKTGERINHAKSIHIGRHVWLGTQVLVSKGVNIADNVIVGAKSLVVKSIEESYVCVGGVPAEIIKRDVDFDKKRL